MNSLSGGYAEASRRRAKRCALVPRGRGRVVVEDATGDAAKSLSMTAASVLNGFGGAVEALAGTG